VRRSQERHHGSVSFGPNEEGRIRVWRRRQLVPETRQQQRWGAIHNRFRFSEGHANNGIVDLFGLELVKTVYWAADVPDKLKLIIWMRFSKMPSDRPHGKG
jgi:hypothetical protein